MNTEQLISLIENIRNDRTSTEEALQQLKKLPFEDLGYAKVDTHRCLRNGVPEVIYCAGKTVPQVQGIIQKIACHHENILATRANPAVYKGIREVLPDCKYHEAARIVVEMKDELEKIKEQILNVL